METTIVYRGHILGLYRDNGKESGNYYSISRLYTRIMEKEMETTIVYWGYIGIMEKKVNP